MVEEILAGLADDRPLGQMRPGINPIKSLIEAYVALAAKNPDLPTYSDGWTGRDLKDAIAKVPSANQVILLSDFQNTVNSGATPWCYPCEDPAARDERRFRHQITLILVCSACFILLIVVGAIIAVGVMSGNLTNGPFVDTVLKMAIEIIKIIFAPGGIATGG